MAIVAPATLDDLARVEGKAELVAGRIVPLMTSGDLPTEVAFEIAVRLRDYARHVGRGKAYADGLSYALSQPLASGRESFCPDASYYHGPLPQNRMRFVPGAPQLAVEVRSENDYGRSAETQMAAKRADYFEAGTQVVWDVDPVARTIAVYRPDESPTVFHVGDAVDAEPALPGWRMNVAEIFPAA
jgi:Uma2 family endonuclease